MLEHAFPGRENDLLRLMDENFAQETRLELPDEKDSSRLEYSKQDSHKCAKGK
jgi:hypothetical protein